MDGGVHKDDSIHFTMPKVLLQ